MAFFIPATMSQFKSSVLILGMCSLKIHLVIIVSFWLLIYNKVIHKIGGDSMLSNYIEIGINELFNGMIMAFLMLPLLISIKFILGKRDSITLLNTIIELSWVSMVITILLITGIIRGKFGTTSLFNGNPVINFHLFSEGLSPATMLNMILFIPFGFLSLITFKKIQMNRSYGILVGFSFSCVIEILQLFTGRFVQLDDILMNTLGSYIGYMFALYLLNFEPFKRFKLISD